MEIYGKLLQKAVDSIAATFPKRLVSGLQSSRSFVIPDEKHHPHDAANFELVTWLVIKAQR